MKILLALLLFTNAAFAADPLPSWNDRLPAAPSEVTAIDILLEPDATMLRHAEANNARLLAVFPKGFALDATHRPHITMVQRFVRTADLDQVYAAEEKVLAGANVNAMKLEAFKYYYAPAASCPARRGRCRDPIRPPPPEVRGSFFNRTGQIRLPASASLARSLSRRTVMKKYRSERKGRRSRATCLLNGPTFEISSSRRLSGGSSG
jgi:hypothetical protein